jgi:thiol-disulfide isomerase/thioredoxin
MKKIIMAIAVLSAIACNNSIMPSNTRYQNKEFVNEKGTAMLIGHNAPYMLKQGIYKEWYDKHYSEYAPDNLTTQSLSSLLKGTTIEVFLGSWCGDSKREVPRMMKILEQAKFDTSNIHLIFVDHTLAAYKQSPQHEEKGKNIHRVPTFIIYGGNEEIGRIIESPVLSLEKDMLSILRKQGYTPKYTAIPEWQKIKARKKMMSADNLNSIADKLKSFCTATGEFNAYGYMLLSSGQKEEAGNVFRLNAIMFPEKPVVYSSLGEFYFQMGEKSSAKKCYEKVLQLKPDDVNAQKMLSQL